uniref:serine/threonine-protein kinase PAK 2-like n=1 Tax=Scatophagus argus TaxID=75038 RepID=UPI001ED843B8|nr:serine/threonine-protein kinase PAK 2-like [Scatophagus argus]
MTAEQSILERNGYTPDKKTIKDNSVVATKGGDKFLIKKITSHQETTIKMRAEQSILERNGYTPDKKTIKDNSVVATKGGDKFLIKKITSHQTSGSADLDSEIEILSTISHPHIVSCKNSFKGNNTHYVVMNYCEGGSLAAKIREGQPNHESQVLSWIVEICVALKTIHEKGLIHKNLTPENVFLTEFGTVCLGDLGKINKNCSTSTQSTTNQTINYLAPEVFPKGTYDAKSDIWSLGCLLYELCTLKPAFSAGAATKLMPTITGGHLPSLTEPFSPELRELLNDMLSRNPQSRPTASEILQCPIMINCLSEKCKSTVETLQKKLGDLRGLADGLERVHQGTTFGSLAGGVIGAAGGITSIVGLVLAPFTLGTSLIVTGVGVGVGVLGGVTAGVSNITKMANQSADRKAVRRIIKEFEEKINAVVIWLQELMGILHTINSRFATEQRQFNKDNLLRLNAGIRAGRGLVGIAELARLAQVINIGKIAAQASRAVRVAQTLTGVFSALFVAVDIFFITMDAKEIHHIRQAQAAEDTGTSSSESESSQNKTPVRSEVMKFVRSIRQAADNLQKVLDELKGIISSLPSVQDKGASWS